DLDRYRAPPWGLAHPGAAGGRRRAVRLPDPGRPVANLNDRWPGPPGSRAQAGLEGPRRHSAAQYPQGMDHVGAHRRDDWGAGRLSPDAEARFIEGVEYCGRFFMGMAEAQKALYRLTAILEAEGLPYAIIGAFALNEYGHRRVTVDVDLVMRDEDLAAFKRRHLGQG